jgi:peptidoglycan/LPS O-acetylase OafA/YrhL
MVSNGVYLWHNLILFKLATHWFTEPGWPSFFLIVGVGLVITIPVAIASYRQVEAPLMRRSRRS